MIGNQQRILLKDTVFYFAYYNMYIINIYIIYRHYLHYLFIIYRQSWTDSRRSSCVINIGDLASGDDTFESILQVSIVYIKVKERKAKKKERMLWKI